MSNSATIGAQRRVLLAPNAFKGTLTARQACAAMAAGVRRAWPTSEVVALPLADGGDGFQQTVVRAHGGTTTLQLVPGPLLVERVPAPIGWFSGTDGRTAVIELAAAAGLALICSPNPATAGAASTRGLGVLIGACLRRPADTILVGVGGSASTDGGAGMARALGYRFVGSDGLEIPEGGLGLRELEHIDSDAVNPLLARVRLIAACDVTSPLLGAQGAAAVYGPQKGADSPTVAELEEGLARLAEVAGRDLGTAGLDLIPGSGAGGGTGFGLLAFCDANLLPGVEVVAEVSGLGTRLDCADLVITGEGRFDLQSLEGKVSGEVARRAQDAGIPCFVIAGSSTAEAKLALRQLGAHLIETRTDVRLLGRGDSRETGRLRRRVQADLREAAARVCGMTELLLPDVAGDVGGKSARHSR